MKDTNFAQLSSEDKVADIKSRITTFKYNHPKLYPEVEKKKEEIQDRDSRLRSLFARS
tara:strand:+ start:992 stop:1165 length:174 start_codon:yes stop_codon:yes gene_type:complete